MSQINYNFPGWHYPWFMNEWSVWLWDPRAHFKENWILLKCIWCLRRGLEAVVTEGMPGTGMSFWECGGNVGEFDMYLFMITFQRRKTLFKI